MMMQPQEVSPVFGNVLPVRVKLAAEWAMTMAHRSFPQIAGNSISIIVEPAPELRESEKEAWDAACELLTDYFSGNAIPDSAEELRHKALQIELQRRRVGQMIDCACKEKSKTQEADPHCVYCHGGGQCLILPVNQPKG